MASSVIAVFGLSGVGKSSLIEETLDSLGPEIASVHAGTLIKQGLPSLGERDLTQLPKTSILRNQLVLARQLSDFVASSKSKSILLDGHCVVDAGEEQVIIPTDAIANLALTAIAFVAEPPAIIRQRRTSDPSRNRPLLSLAQLANHQTLAIDACRAYQEELGIPLVILSASDSDRLSELIERVRRDPC